MPRIRIGTRSSPLALAQTQLVAEALAKFGLEAELIQIRTTGDVSTQPLRSLRGKGAFTSQLQEALLNGEVDLAVHSMKDLPTVDFPGLTIAAIPKRETPLDALVLPAASNQRQNRIEDLDLNARIGTGSIRRKAQLQRLRSDLSVRDIRGNVETRLQQLDRGDFEALVLASAGLIRLGLPQRISSEFAATDLAPAVGQGALAVEMRTDERDFSPMVRRLNDPDSSACVLAERAMLRRLQAGCHAPVGAVSNISGQRLNLLGFVLSSDGQQRVKAEFQGVVDPHGSTTAAVEIGIRVAEMLLEHGAAKFLDR